MRSWSNEESPLPAATREKTAQQRRPSKAINKYIKLYLKNTEKGKNKILKASKLKDRVI